MDLGGLNWTIIDIVGPVLLVAVLLWALLRNRQSKKSMDDTERGTRRVYDEEERARREGGDGRA
jgi:hypothetical protein